MAHHKLLIAALAAATAACSTTGAAGERIARWRVEIPQSFDLEYSLPQFDSIAAAAGLRSLRQAPPPSGQREIRVWIQGMSDTELFRIVERRGQVAGELVLGWRDEPFDPPIDGYPDITWHDVEVYDTLGRCTEFFLKAGIGGCRPTFREPIDLKSTLRRLEEAGIWQLPDESTLADRAIVVDGYGITVELSSSAGYRVYHHSNPSMQPGPEAAQAAELVRIVSQISRRTTPPRSLREYRGQIGGPGRSEFRPCGLDEVWEISELTVRSAASRLGVELPVVPDTTVPPPLYMEGSGALAPPYLARWWGSKHPNVLQLHTATVLRPWTEGSC